MKEVPEKHVTPCGTKTFIITSLSWSLLTGRCKVPMERCRAACRSIRTRSLKEVSMCTWTKEPMLHSISSSLSRVSSHHMAQQRSRMGPQAFFQEAQAVILIDPLGEGNSSYPITVTPWHLQDPVGALEMKGIPLAGQHIDWVQQVFIGRPRAGSIHCGEFPWVILLFDLQVPPSLNDLLKRLIRVAQWASRPGWSIGYMLAHWGKAWGSRERHGSQFLQTVAPDHSPPMQIATTHLRRGEIPSPEGAANDEGPTALIGVGLSQCATNWHVVNLHRWSTCKVSHRQQGKVQYWHFCWKG